MPPNSDGQCQSRVKAVCELKFHHLTASYFAHDMFFIEVTCNKSKSGCFPVCMPHVPTVGCGNKTFLILHLQLLGETEIYYLHYISYINKTCYNVL